MERSAYGGIAAVCLCGVERAVEAAYVPDKIPQRPLSILLTKVLLLLASGPVLLLALTWDTEQWGSGASLSPKKALEFLEQKWWGSQDSYAFFRCKDKAQF